MKKFTVTAIAAVAAVMMYASCDNGTPKANLRSDVDTVSYAIGMAQTQGLKDYLVGRLGVDTTYMDEFIKGLNEGANAGDDKKKAAYYAGIQIGQQISNQMVKGINHELFGEDSTKTISLKNFMAGFISGTTGKGGLMTVDSAAQVAQEMMRTIKAKNMEKEFGPNKKAGEDFLAKNAKAEGVKVTSSGLQYRVNVQGTGDKVTSNDDVVSVFYTGKLISGAQLTIIAFTSVFGEYGKLIVSISLCFFAFSTILGWEYYGEKALEYLFSSRKAIMLYRVFFSTLAFVGATQTLDMVWDFSDTMNGLMAIPNLIALLWLNKEIAAECFDYEENILQKEKAAGILSV